MIHENFHLIWMGILALLCVFVFFYLLRLSDLTSVSPFTQGGWHFSHMENSNLIGKPNLMPKGGKRTGEWAFFLTLFSAGGAFSSSFFFSILTYAILLISCLAPVLTLIVLKKIPQKDKHPDDILEPRISFLLPTLCIYSFFMLNALSSNLGLPHPAQAPYEFFNPWEGIRVADSKQEANAMLLSCIISLLFIYASAIHMISYSLNKILQSSAYLHPESPTLRKLYSYSRANSPRSVWPSIVLASTSLLFSSGMVILRLPVAIEYLIR